MKRINPTNIPPAVDEEQTEAKPTNDAVHTRGHQWLRNFGVGERRNERTSEKTSGDFITSLGSLEAEILGLLWELGRPASGMDVAEASLYKRKSQNLEPIAFSTVNTTLRRLTEKGLLNSQKGDSRTVYYTPIVGREEMAARILNNVSETLLGRSLHGLMPKLLGGLKPHGAAFSSTNEQEEVERLLQALEETAHSAITEARPPG